MVNMIYQRIPELPMYIIEDINNALALLRGFE